MWRYNEYLSNVQRSLKDLGSICQRCVLRFGGVKSSREHRNITIEDPVDLDIQSGPSESKVSNQSDVNKIPNLGRTKVVIRVRPRGTKILGRVRYQ